MPTCHSGVLSRCHVRGTRTDSGRVVSLYQHHKSRAHVTFLYFSLIFSTTLFASKVLRMCLLLTPPGRLFTPLVGPPILCFALPHIRFNLYCPCLNERVRARASFLSLPAATRAC